MSYANRSTVQGIDYSLYKEQSPGFDQKNLQAQDLSNRSSSYEHRAHKEASLVHSQIQGRSGEGLTLPNPPQAHSHHSKDVRGPELYRYPPASTPHKSDMTPYHDMPEKSMDSSNIPALKPNSQHGPASYGGGGGGGGSRAFLSKVVAPGPPPLIKEPSRYPGRGSKVAQPPPHVGGSIVQGLPVMLNSTSPAAGGSISMGTPRYEGHRQPTPPARSDVGSIIKGTPKLYDFGGRAISIDQNSFRMPYEGPGGIPMMLLDVGKNLVYCSASGLEQMYQDRPQSAGYHNMQSGYSSGPTSSNMYHEINNSSAKEVLMGDYMTAKQMNSQGKEGQLRGSEKDSLQPSMSPGSRDAYGRETSKAGSIPPDHLPRHMAMQSGRVMNCKDVPLDASVPGQRTMFLKAPPGQQYVTDPTTSRGNLQIGGSVQDRIHSPRGSSDSGLRTQSQLASQRLNMAEHEPHSHHAVQYHHSGLEAHIRSTPDEREPLPHQLSALQAKSRPQSAHGLRGDQDINGPRGDGGGDMGDGGKNSESGARASQKQLTAANLIDIIITEQINQDALETKPPQTAKILDQLSHSDIGIMSQASQRNQVSPSPPSSMAAPFKPFQNRNIGPVDGERSNAVASQLEALQSKTTAVKREDNSSQSYQQHIGGGGGGGNQHSFDGANRPSHQTEASNSAMTITLGQHIDQIIIQDYKLIENIPGAMTSVSGECFYFAEKI